MQWLAKIIYFKLLGWKAVGYTEISKSNIKKAVIIAVPHRQFAELSAQYFIDTLQPGGCIIDVKSMLDMEELQAKDCRFWRL